MSHTAIYNTHPNVTSINGEGEATIAWDKDGNVVQIDQQLVEIEAARLEAQYLLDQENAKLAKEASLAKLTALGLTSEDLRNILS